MHCLGVTLTPRLGDPGTSCLLGFILSDLRPAAQSVPKGESSFHGSLPEPHSSSRVPSPPESPILSISFSLKDFHPPTSKLSSKATSLGHPFQAVSTGFDHCYTSPSTRNHKLCNNWMGLRKHLFRFWPHRGISSLHQHCPREIECNPQSKPQEWFLNFWGPVTIKRNRSD